MSRHDGWNELLLLGVDHRVASAEVREEAVARIRSFALPLAPHLGAGEAAALCTCNRVELYASWPGEAADEESLARLLGASRGSPHYRKRGIEAARHLCRVASSIEALVFGEPQILGQVREAHARAVEAGDVAGGLLGAAFESALRAGKRVRAETGVGRLAVSVPSVARDLARRIFGELRGREALLLGAGEMAEATARHLHEDGMKLAIASFRRKERAEALASELGASLATYDALGPHLERVDIVVASTAAPHAVLSRHEIERAMPAREGRSLFLVDIAMPRDIEPASAEVEGVFLYALAELEEIARSHRDARASEIEAAEKIVDEEVARYERRAAAILAGPTLAALGARAEEIRSEEVAATVARLLHDPLVEAKRVEEIPVGEKMRFLRKLFRL